MNDNVTLRTNQLIDDLADFSEVQRDILAQLEKSVKEYDEFLKRSLRAYATEADNKYER